MNLLDGLPALDQTATDTESLLMLFALLEYEQPERVVEAGTYQGHFAVAAARMLPETHVLTFDITEHWQMPDMDNLEFVQGDFGEGCPVGFDFAFIDSGPPPYGENPDVRWRHWNIAKDLAAPGALLVCHDTNDLRWTGGPEIAAECMLLTGGRGLGLWRKP